MRFLRESIFRRLVRTFTLLMFFSLCLGLSLAYADRIVKGDGKKETGTKPKPKDVDFVGDEITPPDPALIATGLPPKQESSPKKEKDKTKETEKKPAEKKKETETKPKPKEVDFVGDEITPPDYALISTGLPPKADPARGVQPPHDIKLPLGSPDDVFNTWMPIGKYEEVGGRLWRDFNAGKISKEEYLMKMRMLGELKAQLEKWEEVYFQGLLRAGPSQLERNQQEMEDYRKRIDKRMEEIYEWKPKSKPKEKKTKTDKPIALETGDATGIFQVADSFRGGSTGSGGAPPPSARDMTPMKTAHAPADREAHHHAH